jgi:hypothetical protein
VTAYICGHTHNYSVVNVGGVWQVDAGHARGKGDTGARSTCIRIHVVDNRVSYETYRVSSHDDCEYLLTDTGTLDRPAGQTAPPERSHPVQSLALRSVVLTLVMAVLLVASARQPVRSRSCTSES